ncbi:MAG: hypothetical protein HY912_02490 [Desulfomonile tiedjei]|uniref:Uncharacterized protein n=1 Tax=Desulfomonile tiedjei TaxID=2358 RepID=A0A9D6Z225_9BACT|nr:hypothetical protein [Desulfomonile tiedjei]
MYWWNVSKLAEDFREGRVEEKERFKYFLATSIVWALGAQPFFYYGQTFKIAHVISAAVFVTVTIIGITVCYRANRTGDNTDFVGRMICLSWPISIKLAVLFSTIVVILFGVIFTVVVLGLKLKPGSSKAMDAAGILFGSLFPICYYWLIYKYITLVARPKAPGASQLTSPVESLEV